MTAEADTGDVRRPAMAIVYPQPSMVSTYYLLTTLVKQESLALASMARDDSPASSTAAAAARRPMRGKVGSEFET